MGLSTFYFFNFERGKGREKEEEKHQCVVAFHVPLCGAQARALTGESNQQPFGSQASAQSTESHGQGRPL